MSDYLTGKLLSSRSWSAMCGQCEEAADLSDCSTRNDAVLTLKAYGWSHGKRGWTCPECRKATRS